MLTIHTAERADALVWPLAAQLSTPLPDPFTAEVIALPSRGVERWLSQSLSTRLGAVPSGSDGICANIDFPSPAALVRDVVAVAGGGSPDSAWEPQRLAWAVLEVLDDQHAAPWCRTLARHLGYTAVDDDDREHRQSRRVSVAQRFARRFTAYAEQRPELIRDWLQGGHGDLTPDLAWQADLFRALRAAVAEPSPVELLDRALAALRADPAVVPLPDRVSLFGATRLTVMQLAVLEALAVHREIHLWLPQPSQASWRRLADRRPSVGRRSDDRSHEEVAHPLLASFGRDSRELQLLLSRHLPEAHIEHHPVPDPVPDRGPHTRATTPETTLLARLQRDLREDRAPAADHSLADDDVSLQVHACHGRLRQVEVLRDVVLGLLDDRSDLELRDIVVMCPDIETFAPLVAASFGLADEATSAAHPAHTLHVRLADRSLRETNPVLGVLSRLLELADGRVTASEVIDLAAREPVRRAFAFEDEDLERIGRWVEDAGVRWGVDAESRARFGLGGISQNTWRSGLDRLLVGVAMDEDRRRTFGGVLPVDDVGSGDIDLVGRLAEFVDRLTGLLDRLQGTQPLGDWVEVLSDALPLLTDVSYADGWQMTQAKRQLARATEAAGDRATATRIRLADARAIFADLLQGRPTRSGFRTGHLTLCSMVPMRAVPHPVVILLGLDEVAFPRQQVRDGDDVLADDPQVGEHDPRSEDRQLMLDALLAAEHTFVALYSGYDERTGAPRPASVPMAELLDICDAMLAAPDTGRARDRLVRHHPLQAFDPRNFAVGELTPAEAFSFDPTGYAGSRVLTRPRSAARPLVDADLTPHLREEVALVDLARLLVAPTKAFLQQRLQVSTAGEHREPEDLLRTDVRGLEAWQVGDRLLRAALRDEDFDTVIAAERARGTLPPGPLGEHALGALLADVGALVRWSRGPRSGPPARVDVDTVIEGSEGPLRLHGVVQGVHEDRVVRVEYSRLRPKHRLESWLHLLALTAADPTRPWSTVVAGRGDEDGEVAYAYVEQLDRESARRTLTELVDLHRLGLSRPLPLAEETSAAYAVQRARGADPDAALAAARTKHWSGRFGEGADLAVRQVWGSGDLEAFLALPAPTGSEEPHLFGHVARLLWDPLLAVERRRTA